MSHVRRREDELRTASRSHRFATEQAACVVLELCGVVCDGTEWTRWLWRQVLRWTTRAWNYDTFHSQWQDQYLTPVACGYRAVPEALAHFLTSFHLPQPLIDELTLAAIARQRQFRQSEHVLPGVRECMSQLRANQIVVCLLAFCDWDQHTLHADLARMGLHGLFDSVIWPSDVVAAVSHGSIVWPKVAARLVRSCQELVFVSNDARRLQDAQQQGVTAVGINIEQPQWQGFKIGTMGELAQWLVAPQRAAV